MNWNPFENIGGQLKKTAIILYWLELISEIIASLILFFIEDGDLAWIGCITLFGGIFFTAISTALLYWCGELIDRCCSIDEKLKAFEEKEDCAAQPATPAPKKEVTKLVKNASAFQAESQSVSHKWRCDGCGSMISEYPCSICGYSKEDIDDDDFFADIICPECGEELSFSRQHLKKEKEVQCPLCNATIKCSNL